MKLIDLVNSVVTFLSQITLLRWLTLLLKSLTVNLSPTLLNLFIWLLILLLSPFPLTFCQSQKGMIFSFTAYDCSWADWYHLPYHLRDVQWEDIFFKLGASATAIQFCKQVHVGTDAYLIFYIRSNLTYVHDSQLLVLLP